MKKAANISNNKSGTSSHFSSSSGKPGISGVFNPGKLGSNSGKLGSNSGKLGSNVGKIGSSINQSISNKGSSGGKIETSDGKTVPSKNKIYQPTSKITSSSYKSYDSPSFNTSKHGKSSSRFGILWLPTRKRNKYKEVSHNIHQNERTTKMKERGPSMYGFMSGDSSNSQPFLEKRKEETYLLVPESKASTSLVISEVNTVAASELSPEKPSPVDKQGDSEKAKENAAKKSDDHNNDMIVENAPIFDNKEKVGDTVDSVVVRSPPPQQTKPSPPAVEEEEDCGIKCLYYTLQCCDCVLM